MPSGLTSLSFLAQLAHTHLRERGAKGMTARWLADEVDVTRDEASGCLRSLVSHGLAVASSRGTLSPIYYLSSDA